MTEIQMTKTKKQKGPYNGAFVLNFEHLNFEFVSDFEIRISCLWTLTHPHGMGDLLLKN